MSFQREFVLPSLLASLRLTFVTLAICVGAYTAAILGVANVFAPWTAEGALLTEDGRVVGSRVLAQAFTKPGYFWPRPSAVGYNAMGAGGSNRSPTSSELTDRARQLVARYHATAERPLPADLAAASGGGLDPDVTEHAALYQAGRVARARGIPRDKIEQLVHAHAFAPGGTFTPDRLVNVLELNLAVDRIRPAPAAAQEPADK